MPRSGGGRSGGGRSAPARAPARPQAPAPAPRPVAPQQQRPMSTTTAQGQAPPQTQSPGLFGQMASTAAGVAVGSSIGHAISGFFGGGSSQQQAPEQAYSQDAYAEPTDSGMYNAQSQAQNQAMGPCAQDIKSFTSCMDQNQGNMAICGWYLDQLKACQAATKQH